MSTTTKLREGEFALDASLRPNVVATTRNRRRKLVHFAQSCKSVWRRRPGGMPELVRIAATASCGQPILSAAYVPQRDDEVYCDACVRAENRQLHAQGEVDF